MSTASSTSRQRSDSTHCQICFELYNTPKLLRCGHLVCKECLLSLVNKDGLRTICPFCRRSVVYGSGDRDDWTSWVNQLPTDLSMQTLVECQRVLYRTPLCSICEGDISAHTYCLTCAELFCQICTKVHQKQRATMRHEVKVISEITADQLKASRVLCEDHLKVSVKIILETNINFNNLGKIWSWTKI